MLDFPLEYALVVFPGNKFSGEIVPALLDLADRDIIRFVDIVFVRKTKTAAPEHSIERSRCRVVPALCPT